VGQACQSIYESILPAAGKEEFILTIGGDHSIPLGTIPAIMEKRPGTKVVWVDAHADINTPDTSGSGNMHGQPLGLLVNGVYKPGVSSLPGFEWLASCLNPEDIVFIGLRDVDRHEKIAIRDFGIKAYTMFDIDRIGIGRVLEEVVDFVGDNNMHLSFDIDACDPFFAPSTGTKVGGGLTLREAHFVCESLADTQVRELPS
jgi:arginase